jgi:catechol 2,3-dioxygenase-like lactoylglutathione lyase family enzyme
MNRILWAALLALSSLIASGTQSCVSTAHADPLPLVRAVGCIGFTVSDADRSAEFYSRVLGSEKVADVEQAGDPLEQLEGVFGARVRTVRMRLGRECLDLTEYWHRAAARLHPMRAATIDPSSTPRSSFRTWTRRMPRCARRASSTLPPARRHCPTGTRTLAASAPSTSATPIGVEVIQFPRGKGDARWQAGDRLFLGIDHTAIVVGDTDASLRFYRDTLGLRVAGTSENWGTEQEHLNNVSGARLRITTLRGASGPGVELLEYLAPRDGRPIAPDERANDLIHWQTTLFTGDLNGAAAALRGLHAAVRLTGRGRALRRKARLFARPARPRSRRPRPAARSRVTLPPANRTEGGP